MKTRRKPAPRKPYVAPPPAPPIAESLALEASLSEVFTSMQLQANLELMKRTHAIGLFHKVDLSHEHYLTAEVCTEGHRDVICSFTVGVRVDLGRVHLKVQVSTTFCDDFDVAETRFKALMALMEVARMLEKTYVQTWSFSAR